MIRPALSDNSFIVDVATTITRYPDQLHLWWLGQSGYLIGWNARTAAIDPYLSDSLTKKYEKTDKPHVRISDRVVWPQGLVHTNLQVVAATHQHTDHLDPETLKPLLAEGPWIKLIAPEAHRELAAERSGTIDSRIIAMARDDVTCGGFTFTAVRAAHDKLETDERGHDKYLGYVIHAGPYAIYHSGDTVRYEAMEKQAALHHIDIAILPINGKVGNMNGYDAAHLAKAIGAKLVIPCHYDMFEFNTADPYEQFVPECKKIGQPYRVLKLGERFTFPEKP